jgi:hypothetical protein
MINRGLKFMKTKFFCIVGLIALIPFLASCGGGGGDDSSPEPAEETASWDEFNWDESDWE